MYNWPSEGVCETEFVKHIGIRSGQVRNNQVTLVDSFDNIPKNISLIFHVVSTFNFVASLLKCRFYEFIINGIKFIAEGHYDEGKGLIGHHLNL